MNNYPLQTEYAEILAQIKDAVINGHHRQKEDVLGTKELVEQALEEKIDAKTILDKGLIAGMKVVGERFGKHEIYIPEVVLSSRAMEFGREVLEQYLVQSDYKPKATVVIGNVLGELHDIGKNIVRMMLRGNGYWVVDLGKDVRPGRFIESIAEHRPQLIGLSASMTTTMPEMRHTIEQIENGHLRDLVKIIIGGASAINMDYAKKIGADGYAPDAASAVIVANRFIAK